MTPDAPGPKGRPDDVPKGRPHDVPEDRPGAVPPGAPDETTGGPADGATPARRRGWRTAAGVAAAALLLAGGVVAWFALALRPVDPGDAAARTFDVPPGTPASAVATSLEAAGLVRDATAFAAWMRLRGLDTRVGAGLYDLAPAMDGPTVAARLAAGGRPRTVTWVVPEGWRLRDVAASLAELGVASEAAALARLRRPGDLAPAAAPDGATLEGYLFPATYELRADAALDAALERAVREMEARLARGLAVAAELQGLSVHALLTLASLVQAEAAHEGEMAIIAGVFRNRLDRGMRLQSDPTVAYGLDKDLPELSAVDGDLERDHAWNTYTRAGLPVGPIGNPGEAALRAVLAPDRTRADGAPWLYFLHGSDDGEPVFRPNATYAAHVRDVERYLR